jgi:two-component system, OmpR family, sensor kinase
MIFNSIRWRLQVWHGLILVVVLAGFGFTAYQVASDNQLRRIDQELEQQLAIVSRPPPQREAPPDRPPSGRPSPEDRRRGGPGPRGDPAYFRQRMQEHLQQVASSEIDQSNSFYFVMWQPDGSVAVRSSGAPADVPIPERTPSVGSESGLGPDGRGGPPRPDPGPPGFSAARTRGELREVFRFMPFDDCILVGRSIAPDLAAMHRLALWFVAAGAAVLVLGLAGGWWLATRAIGPIEEISATAVKIAGGDLSQRINAADTDNELGRLAGVLNSTFARLEAAFAHQARFTSDASHELRTPVSVILSQTQTALSRERAASEYREALEACQRAAQRMRRLTESLLELARLDAGQEPMKRDRFELSRVARECVELVRPLAAERGIEIRCDLPAIHCLGDAERITQVATNLLTNAINFNRDRGEVRVSARVENSTALLTVADTGVGISAEDIPHIFERFYRVDKSRSGIQGRTGLGLAICKAIMDAHGGSIDVSSQPGAGTTVTVRLPA